MSVKSGSPVLDFTLSKIFRPSSSPGPRNPSMDVRFALSNDALKISGTLSSEQVASSFLAIKSVMSPGSITHGPAMSASGRSRPICDAHHTRARRSATVDLAVRSSGCGDLQVRWCERFSSADADNRGLAFAAYTAALDREASAARSYEDQVNRLTPDARRDPNARGDVHSFPPFPSEP